MNWGLGLRNVKTGIAIGICLVIALVFKLNSPFYAAIATIISMENTITNSFAAGRHRVMGTLVGAVIGSGFAFVAPGNALLCALGVILVIYICNLLHWPKSVSIGCIVFLAVMLNLGTGSNPLAYGFHRIMDTLVGIAVAVAVNYLIFPPRLEERLEQKRAAFAERLSLEYKKAAERGEEIELPSLRAELISLEQAFEQWKNEIHPRKQTSRGIADKEEVLSSYRHVYEHLVILQRLREEQQANAVQGEPPIETRIQIEFEINQQDLQSQETAHRELAPLRELNNQADIVYNYHRNWIYQELRKHGLPVPDINALLPMESGGV